MSPRLKRRDFIKLAGSTAAAGFLARIPLFPGFPTPAERPNVLFIAVDDLRPELGCYGSTLVKTPNIDRLARQGLVFNRAYCQMPICNPSRSSLLTGIRPDTLRIWDNQTHFRKGRPDVVTLPMVFKNAGYESVKIGKIFHGSLPDPISWSRPEPSLPPRPIYMSPETRARQKERREAALKKGWDRKWVDAYLRGPATEAHDSPDNFYLDGAIAEAALIQLSSLQKTPPFFLAIGFTKPHLPFVAPKRYWDFYKREEIPLAENDFLPRNAPLMAMNRMIEFATYEDLVRIPSPTERKVREDRARLLKHGYYACVSFIDAQIGRLLSALDHFGLRENTIIVVWSDHGYKLGEHGSWGKRTVYEVDTRSTLIISVPDLIPDEKSTTALVELVDIFPTLAELAGLGPPDDLEGTSLVPLLHDPSRQWKKAAFSQFARGSANRFMGRAMRTARYRYIEWRNRIDGRLETVELYDHDRDPQENENIANVPENKALIENLAREMKAGWRAALPE